MQPRKRPADAPVPRAKRLVDQLRDATALAGAMDAAPSDAERAAITDEYRRLLAAMLPLVAQLPRLPDDVVQLIIELRTRRRTLATFGAGGAVIAPRPIHLPVAGVRRRNAKTCRLRLVCPQWARCAGRLVDLIRAPKKAPVAAACVRAAFPNICGIGLWVPAGDWVRGHELEALIAAYTARPGRRLSVHTNFIPTEPINLAGAYLYAASEPTSASKIHAAYTCAGAPVSIMVYPNGNLYALIDSDPVDAGCALTLANVVAITHPREPTLACNFRAGELCLGHVNRPMRWTTRAVRSYLDPARWVGGVLPVVRIGRDHQLLAAYVRTLIPAERVRVLH